LKRISGCGLVGVFHGRVDFFGFLSMSELVHEPGVVFGLGGYAAVGHTRIAVFSLKEDFALLSFDSFGLCEKAIKISCVSEPEDLTAFS